jgi:transcriptional regulator with XRE-family HTH domain
MSRQEALRRWMEDNERGPSWVAQKVGYTREWISYVLNGHKPFSDKLARALQETLGVPFDNLPKAQRSTTRKRGATQATKE